MYRPFHRIITEGTLDVYFQGETAILELPEWLAKAEGKLENEEQLLQWAIDQNVLLPALQAGIQKVISDLRANARPPAGRHNVPVGIIDDIDNAQKRMDDFRWDSSSHRVKRIKRNW